MKNEIVAFEARQLAITNLLNSTKAVAKALEKEYQEKATLLKAEYEEKIKEAERQLNTDIAKYRSDLKAAFGVTDGETIDVLSFVKAIIKVKESA